MEKISGVYKITCVPTGDTYVGSSINILSRWDSHESEMRTGLKRGIFKELAKKYGCSNFTYSILEECSAPQSIEQKWIDLLSPTLNIATSAKSFFVGKDFGRKGEEHNLARHTKEYYISILRFLCKDLDNRTPHVVVKYFPDTTVNIIKRIRNQSGHGWLQQECPVEWNILSEYRNKKRTKEHHLITPDGRTIVSTNLNKLAKEEGLDPSSLYKLVKGKLKSHKKWRLSDA